MKKEPTSGIVKDITKTENALDLPELFDDGAVELACCEVTTELCPANRHGGVRAWLPTFSSGPP